VGSALDLGFGAEDRVVVVHVDDLGMSQAANQGALLAFEGAATCGSVMVPCPGFDELVELAAGRTDLDIGVHLTLNAEYESWRWDPVSDRVPGLVSTGGGMWRSTAETVEHASVEEVEIELRAQIDRALDAGLDVTHLDSHMGTVLNPKFVDVYVLLGREYRLPLFIPRIDESVLSRGALGDNMRRYVELVAAVEADGFPVFDQFNADSLEFEPGKGTEHNRRRIEGFAPGLSYLITHCARGGEQLESITHDWRQRDEEHRIYSKDGSMQQVIEAAGVRTIGMRPLRDLLRQRL